MGERNDRESVRERDRRDDRGQTRLFIAAIIVCATVIAGAGAVRSHHAAPDQPVVVAHR